MEAYHAQPSHAGELGVEEKHRIITRNAVIVTLEDVVLSGAQLRSQSGMFVRSPLPVTKPLASASHQAIGIQGDVNHLS